MAGEAEEKKISKLDFDINNAIKKLEKIDSKLKDISESSEKYAKNIGLALNSGIDYKTLAKSVGMSEKQLLQLNKKTKMLALDTAQYREKQEIKTTEVLKREQAKQAQSVETLSDKICNQ